VNQCNNGFHLLIRQFFLIPNRINEFVYHCNVLRSAWISSGRLWSLTGGSNNSHVAMRVFAAAILDLVVAFLTVSFVIPFYLQSV
jgi:hypothetical protein